MNPISVNLWCMSWWIRLTIRLETPIYIYLTTPYFLNLKANLHSIFWSAPSLSQRYSITHRYSVVVRRHFRETLRKSRFWLRVPSSVCSLGTHLAWCHLVPTRIWKYKALFTDTVLRSAVFCKILCYGFLSYG